MSAGWQKWLPLGGMPLPYILYSLWNWFIDTGFTLALLIVLAFLVPRFGRIAMRIVERQVADESLDESKTHLAFAGVAVYVAQVIAYFIIFVFALQQLGFSLAGAAIPATAASAAIGLGAQSIIADFLAGFFVLSEKQYGVGDWVRFEGGTTTVEGTVIQITMRATRIRTLAEETVIIPNSKAGVSINNSNYWSRAVVVMPIPLLGSHSIQEAIDRGGRAARKALARPEIAQEVLGELTVHDSVGVNPPATVGSPWTVSMRFLCQVKPGSQWMVERAIRTSLIDEFWAEYGSAPTLNGAVADTLHSVSATPTAASAPTLATGAAQPVVLPLNPDGTVAVSQGSASSLADVATTVFRAAAAPAEPSSASAPRSQDPDGFGSATHTASASPKDQKNEVTTEHVQDPAADEGGINSAARKDIVRPQDESDAHPAASTAKPVPSDGNEPTPALLPEDSSQPFPETAAAASVPEAGAPQADSPDKEDAPLDEDENAPAAATGGRVRRGLVRILTVGGRTRVSTTILMIVFILLLVLKGLTLQTSESYDGKDGVLAPARTTTSSPQPAGTSTARPEATPSPTQADAPTTASSGQATPGRQAPEASESTNTPATNDNGNGTGNSGREDRNTDDSDYFNTNTPTPAQATPTGAPTPEAGAGGTAGQSGETNNSGNTGASVASTP